ncbi:polysaccharide deacetylase family protein [Nonomuraea endophytica]|uniref:Peptidoglycan/xylan/chitin deacetylase (PgdA/CDA1 family) n=1 Tax=Nonomuraea endophytica TaxID=714136 RepID=A0A7W8A0D9_9ACTN|nr:polysaccharide deacetylase family protein [Nonomuraea endophytica]MBB5077220.1 peptidoglycan/xylan/chitin deacetylase (PgdA/CDA1 family) [Nonomuraea endophytica]
MRPSLSSTRVIGAANVAVILVAVVALMIMPGDDPGDRPPPEAVKVGQIQPAPSSGRPSSPGPSVQPSGQPSGQPSEPAPIPTASQPPAVVATPEFARQVKANEAGLVPIIMYHRIIKKRMASIDRTPDQLRQELEKLAKQGYVPITAAEFAAGRIQVPAGKFPVVLTFDDGHSSHFALDDQGRPAKNTAVAIIYDVARKYPSFRPVATFWVNHYPFGLQKQEQQASAAQWLHRQGFEVANHTWTHPNLRAMGTKKVREQIARLERMLKKLGVPPSTTMALPFGSMPHKKKAARKGEWGGVRYDFDAVFLAGAEPSLSPFAKGYDPGAVQRIQSNGKKGECRKWCSQYWLEWLQKHPGWRYVSDGDPDRVSVPKKLQGNIAAKRRDQVNAY